MPNSDQSQRALPGRPLSAEEQFIAGSAGSFAGGTHNASSIFAPPINYATGPYSPSSVAVADVNGDGKLDLLVATVSTAPGSNENGALGVLLGNGDGSFQPVVFYDSGGLATSVVVVADVNGDGKPDVLMADYCGYEEDSYSCDVSIGEGALSVLLGNGDGSFQSAVTYPVGFGADALAVADVNGDGRPDIIVVNSGLADEYYGGGGVAIFLGNGDGTFQAPSGYGSGGYDADSLAVADLNGDGKPDLVVLNECPMHDSMGQGGCNYGVIAVFLGNGDGTFQSAENYGSGATQALSLAVGDINGDGKPDLLVLNGCLSPSECSIEGVLAVLLGNGDGTFQEPLLTAIPPDSFGGIALADFNGDGKLDATTDGIVLLGKGDGVFQNFVSFNVSASAAVAVGDFNGDGKPDLALGIQDAGAAILLNITPAAATMTALASSPNPSTAGKPSTFIANVASGAGTPTGRVRFMSGATVLGTRMLNQGRTVLDIADLPVGLSSINAVYEGSAKFRVSASGTVQQVVLGTTTTTLTSSPNPSNSGETVTFMATVGSGEGPPPDGETVSFMKGKTVLGTGTLSGGSASFAISTLKVGTTVVKAVYGGDSNNFAGSVSEVVKQVIRK